MSGEATFSCFKSKSKYTKIAPPPNMNSRVAPANTCQFNGIWTFSNAFTFFYKSIPRWKFLTEVQIQNNKLLFQFYKNIRARPDQEPWWIYLILSRSTLISIVVDQDPHGSGTLA